MKHPIDLIGLEQSLMVEGWNMNVRSYVLTSVKFREALLTAAKGAISMEDGWPQRLSRVIEEMEKDWEEVR